MGKSNEDAVTKYGCINILFNNKVINLKKIHSKIKAVYSDNDVLVFD